MPKIAYILHRFPGITDTFIRREIRSLLDAGTEVQVISVWKPRGNESTAEIVSEWLTYTDFVLPRSALSILKILLSSSLRHPDRFFATLHLAYTTSRPGLRGITYQLFYFVQAVLVADCLRRKAITHVHNHIGDQSGTVTMFAAKLAAIGYSISFHGWPVFFDAKFSRIKEKVLAAQFTRSISYFCRSQLMMFSESEDPTSFKVVHCGLVIERYRYRAPREKISRLFCAARLSPEKGHFFSVQAIKLLLNMGHEVELRLAGDGPSRARLENLSMELGISNNVHFLGNLTEEQVIQELESADLFLLSSYVEGIPVSAMEAMAVGVPVIATNVAGTSELIEDGRNGLLVRPSDAQALADAVVRMMHDYPFRLRAAQLGRQLVQEEFDVRKETDKLNGFLLQAAQAERPGSIQTHA